MSGWARTAVAILTIGATLLAILAVAVFEGFLPVSLVGNFTAVELGAFSALAAGAAIAIYAVYDA